MGQSGNYGQKGIGLVNDVHGNSFAAAARRYIELTRRDQLVRRDVAVVVMNGLTESLQLERKRVPGRVLYEADRLESCSLLDTHFEGDEPPGL